MHPPVVFCTLTADNGSRIGVATLNAEKTLNALSLEMVDLLFTQLQAWSRDERIALVLLQAAGEKAFCAGGDLQDLYQAMLTHHASAEKDDIRANSYACEFFAREYRLDYLIHTYPKPILCWGHGIVMGGGIGLLAGASHRVVTERSRLAMPEIAIGLFPDVGGSWFLHRMPRKIGLFLALTGTSVNAADAKFVGLADHAIAQAEKATVLDALLHQPWGADCSQNSAVLESVLRNIESECSLVQTAGPLQQHADLINVLCSGDSLSQVVAAITALQADDVWLQQAAAALATGAPCSASLTYALQQRVPGLSLADVFRMEYIAALHCAARPDFAEGIRALLIDKDRQPRWRPAKMAHITQDWVDVFFVSPWSASEHPLADLGATNALFTA